MIKRVYDVVVGLVKNRLNVHCDVGLEIPQITPCFRLGLPSVGNIDEVGGRSKIGLTIPIFIITKGTSKLDIYKLFDLFQTFKSTFYLHIVDDLTSGGVVVRDVDFGVFNSSVEANLIMLQGEVYIVFEP